ncbi:hypothetical protein L9H26_18885 [Morganella psychrotolerans]|uniref:Uncharacterized protein n=1 Tax=Morganella psychrotolerans TaxID=368603 RepID=A0A5M9QX09_9GAMM|nr:hypothetical protein [Morganella psychrotolerans]KAA8712970.1 hypothetical protein F4V73_17785 [Morganella psychrotolerans]
MPRLTDLHLKISPAVNALRLETAKGWKRGEAGFGKRGEAGHLYWRIRHTRGFTCSALKSGAATPVPVR